jgi:hypothetical protein
LLAAIAPDGQGDGRPRLAARDLDAERVGVVDRGAIDRHDDIARFDTCGLGRAAGHDFPHEDAARVGAASLLRGLRRQRFDDDAELTALINCCITLRAMFDGIAKPIPMLPPDVDRICELMPTSSPCAFTSAPPELP